MDLKEDTSHRYVTRGELGSEKVIDVFLISGPEAKKVTDHIARSTVDLWYACVITTVSNLTDRGDRTEKPLDHQHILRLTASQPRTPADFTSSANTFYHILYINQRRRMLRI